jgi:DNA-binding MarR family transcriptional regulator
MGSPNYVDKTRAGYALRDFYAKSQLEMDRLLKTQGISLPRVRLLGFILEKGETRSVDVAEAFSYAPRTVTEALDGLEKAGLIERRASLEDRRSKRIVLTDAGREALALAQPTVQHFVNEVFGALDKGEQEMLAVLVEKLTARLDRIASERERSGTDSK